MKKQPVMCTRYEREKTAIDENFNISGFRQKRSEIFAGRFPALLPRRPFFQKSIKSWCYMLHSITLINHLDVTAYETHSQEKDRPLGTRHIGETIFKTWKKNYRRSLKMMIRTLTEFGCYTEKEKQLWNAALPKNPLPLIQYDSDVDHLLESGNRPDKHLLKEKYRILSRCVLFFAARFDNPYRRPDLLIDVIKLCRPKKYAFIIVGDGKHKPDLKNYPNVYDFGQVYDRALKNVSFFIADLYFQPAWTGLSIVEAKAYGIPALPFKRAEDIFQCVEYAYIKDRENGIDCHRHQTSWQKRCRF
jgi:hypothetical protein